MRSISTGPASQSSPVYVSAACRGRGLLFTDIFNSASVALIDTTGNLIQTFNASDPNAFLLSAVCDEAHKSIWAMDGQSLNITLYQFTDDGKQAQTVTYAIPDGNMGVAPLELDPQRGRLLLAYSLEDPDTYTVTNYVVSFDTGSGKVVDVWNPEGVWGIGGVALHHNTSRLYIADFYGQPTTQQPANKPPATSHRLAPRHAV